MLASLSIYYMATITIHHLSLGHVLLERLRRLPIWLRLLLLKSRLLHLRLTALIPNLLYSIQVIAGQML